MGKNVSEQSLNIFEIVLQKQKNKYPQLHHLGWSNRNAKQNFVMNHPLTDAIKTLFSISQFAQPKDAKKN